MDEQTGIILAAKNPDERLPMASTTKIMTGLLALEHTKDLKTVVVTPKAAVGIPESSIYLSVGEKLTVDQLMQALLIPSANDAAVDLAIWVAGSEKKFVELMNRRAAQLGLVNTHYANPHGLDAAAHYTSARDLATLARVAMQDPRFRSYVDDFQAKIPWKGHSYPRLLVSHNTFLENYSWIDGVKTGWTDPAGYCVALSGEYGGRRYVVALLGDPTDAARLTDGVNLFHYGPSFYDSRQLSTPGVPVAHVSVPYHDEGADVVTTKALSATVRNGAAITAKVEAATQAGLPLQQGQVLGEMVFYADGVEIGRQKLTAERGFPAASWSARMRYRAHNAWDWVTSIF